MSESMAQRIKKLRQDRGLTLEQVAEVVGVGKSTVRKWETGMIANMRRDKIADLAKALGTTPAYLMGWEESTIPENIIPVPEMRQIPLIGTIACGQPILAEENIEEYIDIPKHIKADYALTCKGDSMINARIFDGDIVYIRKQDRVETGEIAAVLIEGEATLKRFYLYPEKQMLILKAENPKYEDYIFVGSEIEQLRILGKAIAFTGSVR